MLRKLGIGFTLLLATQPWSGLAADAKPVSPVVSESMERAAEHASDQAQESAERAFDSTIPAESDTDDCPPPIMPSQPAQLPANDTPAEPIVAPNPIR